MAQQINTCLHIRLKTRVRLLRVHINVAGNYKPSTGEVATETPEQMGELE